MIENHVKSGLWKPIRITPSIFMSHMFYADDVFLFGNSSIDNVTEMMNIINNFGDLSGLMINQSKSSMIFPTKMNHAVRTYTAGYFGFKCSTSFDIWV